VGDGWLEVRESRDRVPLFSYIQPRVGNSRLQIRESRDRVPLFSYIQARVGDGRLEVLQSRNRVPLFSYIQPRVGNTVAGYRFVNLVTGSLYLVIFSPAWEIAG
jgi:hypothetical protein